MAGSVPVFAMAAFLYSVSQLQMPGEKFLLKIKTIVNNCRTFNAPGSHALRKARL